MKLLLIISFLIFFTTSVSAQNLKLPSTEVGEDKFNASSPFYLLKIFKEEVVLLFSFSGKNDLKLASEFALDKLEEINSIAGKADNKVPETIKNFQTRVSQMLALKDQDFSNTISQMATHLGMLQRLYAKVQTPDAKASIARAIDEENNQIQIQVADLPAAAKKGISKLVIYRQLEAIKFLKKESTGSSLPKEYAEVLRQTFEKRLESIEAKNNSVLGVSSK